MGHPFGFVAHPPEPPATRDLPSPPAKTRRAAFPVALALLVVGFTGLAAEVALRGYFATIIGPSVLWYGTDYHRASVDGTTEHSPLARDLLHRRLRGEGDEFHNVRQHDFEAGNYTKYFPNEERYTYDADTGQVYTVKINSRGFRGAEYNVDKSPGTIRVVTLGASSTFGYHNPDDLTYPVLLERALNEGCVDGPRYEVLNLGIPHLTSAEIVSLFLAEGLPLDPDVVTFYEGINDSSEDPEDAGENGEEDKDDSVLRDARRWAREHFLLPYFIHEYRQRQKKRFEVGQVEACEEARPEAFVANLQKLLEACRTHGALLIVGEQQARSLIVPREELHGVTYAEEVALVREKLRRRGYVSKLERNLLVHQRILEAQGAWARAQQVPVAPILDALDEDRDMLVSWVHLSPEGNAVVARTYAREILARTCRPLEAAAP